LKIDLRAAAVASDHAHADGGGVEHCIASDLDLRGPGQAVGAQRHDGLVAARAFIAGRGLGRDRATISEHRDRSGMDEVVDLIAVEIDPASSSSTSRGGVGMGSSQQEA
jgi:hypothetical protein